MSSLISTKHTTAAINLIKKQLQKISKVLNIVIQIFFICYYIFLIATNYNRIVYLVIYSCLFVVTLTGFIMELVLSKKDAEEKKKIKKKTKYIFKGIKYSARIIIIALAIYEISTVEVTSVKVVMTAFSILLFIIQIAAEVVINLAINYINYLKLAIQLDMENSSLLKIVAPKKTFSKFTGSIASNMEGEEKYTEKEQERISLIKDEIETLKLEKEEKNKNTLKSNLSRIKTQFQLNYVNKRVNSGKLDDMYQNNLKKSSYYLNNSKKLNKLIEKVNEKVNKYPEELSALKYVPIFISMMKDYDSAFYKDASDDCYNSIIACMLYLDSSSGVIHNFVKSFGYYDDAEMVKIVLNSYESEINQYQKYAEKHKKEEIAVID